MRVFRFFWQYLKKYKWTIVLIFLLMLANASLAMVSPYLSGTIVDEVIQGGRHDLLATYLGLLILSIFTKSIVRFFSLMNIEKTSQNFLYDVRNDVYGKMQGMDFSYFDRTKTGNIMTIISGDLQVIRQFIASSATTVFESFFSFTFAMIILLRMNVPFTLLLLMVTPLIGYLTFRMTKETSPLKSEWHDQVRKLNSVVQENIAGNRVVKAFANEEFEISKFDKENDGYKDEYNKWVVIWKKYLPAINLIGGMMTVIIILVGGILVINNKLSYGELVIYTGLVGTLNVPLNIANWLSDQVQKFFTSGEKVIELMTVMPNITDDGNALDPKDIKGKVEFKNVAFSYSGEKAMKGVTLTVESGQTVGIMGATGSGKTTLVNLIPRFYDSDQGEVLIDGINIKKIKKNTLRRNIAVAMQDTFLFSDTIEGNICYGMPDATMEEIIKAADTAGASEFIVKTQEGYDTIVGERGVGLSGGQRQRVSLARAIIKDSPIMIFDDITSSVDVETEQHIQSMLKKVFTGKTTFIISHRISSVRNCDKIYILDNGKITEEGTHRELMEIKGYYYNVFMIQSGRAGEIAPEDLIV